MSSGCIAPIVVCSLVANEINLAILLTILKDISLLTPLSLDLWERVWQCDRWPQVSHE